jgi:hypothetical protein
MAKIADSLVLVHRCFWFTIQAFGRIIGAGQRITLDAFRNAIVQRSIDSLPAVQASSLKKLGSE